MTHDRYTMRPGADFVPKARQFTDPVRTFAYGTDASFYRLNPKLVVKVHTEEEIKRILPIAKKHGVPITFRAAGTSLSGQALTDSVLLKISHTGKNFRNFEVHVRCAPVRVRSRCAFQTLEALS
jgi:D-lactate dehydrogenase